MSSLLLLWLLTTASYYLGSRAMITRFAWAHYPPSFAAFMDCAACSGFWYGAGLSTLFVVCQRDLPFQLTADPLSIFVCGLVSMVLTPIGGAIMTRAFEVNGSVVGAPNG
jgi:hypothetical protein